MNLLRLSDGIVRNMEMLHSIEPQSDGTIRLTFSSGPGILLYRRMDIDLLNAWVAEQGSAPEPTPEMIEAGRDALAHAQCELVLDDASAASYVYSAMCAKRRER